VSVLVLSCLPAQPARRGDETGNRFMFWLSVVRGIRRSSLACLRIVANIELSDEKQTKLRISFARGWRIYMAGIA